MGILQALGLSKRPDYLAPGGLSIASPFSDGGNLKTVILSDLFGSDVVDRIPMTRGEAISLPAVSKGRNLLVSTIGKFPLVALNKAGVLPDDQQPTFLYRTDTTVTPLERIQWTIDDLIFYGCSMWEVERGASDQITKANWLPTSEWNITDGNVLIREKEADPSSFILFNSAFEGLLNIANRTLRGARDIETAWVRQVRNPIPLTVLKDSDTAGREQSEVDDLLAQWSKARRSEDGALGYLPYNLDMDTHGEANAEMFVEGRNASRTDIGSFLNIPVAMLDGTIGVDSLTYSTTEGNRNRFYEESVPFWTDPIEARLSMDDVVPRGQRVRFDKTEAYALSPTPTDAAEQD